MLFQDSKQRRVAMRTAELGGLLQAARVVLAVVIVVQPLPACASLISESTSLHDVQALAHADRELVNRPAGIKSEEQRKQIARIARSFAISHAFSGDIVVAKGTRYVYAEAFGWRNREGRLRNRVSTKFQIGSISKWITVIAILKLVDEGKLALDAPITTYLKHYPIDIGGKISLADLLSNMSGLQDHLPTSLINDPAVAASTMSAGQAVELYADGPLVSVPGTTFDYAHTNWVSYKRLWSASQACRLKSCSAERYFRLSL